MKPAHLFAFAAALAAPAAVAQPARPLTVVELFQSEGCSSCPPAEAILNKLAARPEILALSFEVTYWDQLGWKDRYGSPAFTRRQQDYANAARRDGVYTPQMVFNGREAIVGATVGEVAEALRHAAPLRGDPVIGGGVDAVTVSGRAPAASARVLLVTYDPRVIEVPIRAGENNGRTLPHRNIVLSLTDLGEWRGGLAQFPVKSAAPGTARAVLVQAGAGGALLAAARI